MELKTAKERGGAIIVTMRPIQLKEWPVAIDHLRAEQICTLARRLQYDDRPAR
jgi:hypothetical protein